MAQVVSFINKVIVENRKKVISKNLTVVNLHILCAGSLCNCVINVNFLIIGKHTNPGVIFDVLIIRIMPFFSLVFS